MNGFTIGNGGCSVDIDTRIYSVEAIKKTAYKFADRASIILKTESDYSILAVFNFTGANAKNDLRLIISDFFNELLDQDLREIVKKETGPLRNALIAHAFSQTSLTNGSK